MDTETAGLLARLYEERADFAKIFDYLATRRRNWNELVVDRLVDEADLDDLGAKSAQRKAVIEFFRRLEAIGIGKLILGRGKRKTRFHWVRQITMLETATAARQDGSIPVGEGQAREGEVEVDRPTLLNHQFTLRPDFVVRLELPADLTPVEADRLKAFIHALPFEGRKRAES
jgi:hypothetical protein